MLSYKSSTYYVAGKGSPTQNLVVNCNKSAVTSVGSIPAVSNLSTHLQAMMTGSVGEHTSFFEALFILILLCELSFNFYNSFSHFFSSIKISVDSSYITFFLINNGQL